MSHGVENAERGAGGSKTGFGGWKGGVRKWKRVLVGENRCWGCKQVRWSKTGAGELRRVAGGVNGGSGDLAMGADSWKAWKRAYEHQ